MSLTVSILGPTRWRAKTEPSLHHPMAPGVSQVP
nr:MAG TPA: hypothetical protein [Caudoviricetes sp.]